MEQSLAESARKFATCVRKYLMLYLRLCELTSDWEALERAAHFLRTDKKVRKKKLLIRTVSDWENAVCQATTSCMSALCEPTSERGGARKRGANCVHRF